MGTDFHHDQPRDWHGRYAGTPTTRTSGPPEGAEEIHRAGNGRVRVLLTGGRTPAFQVWKGQELVHEQPATRNWRQERKDLAAMAAQLAGAPPALAKRPEGREVFSAGGVTAIVTQGNEPRFQVYKGDALVHEQPATRAWRTEQQEVVKIAQQHAGIAPTASQQINADLRAGTVQQRAGEVTLRQKLDYAYLYVENQLAINPALNVKQLQQKGMELAEKWATQGPSRFEREHQFQVSRDYQRHLEEEDVDRNKDIYE